MAVDEWTLSLTTAPPNHISNPNPKLGEHEKPFFVLNHTPFRSRLPRHQLHPTFSATDFDDDTRSVHTKHSKVFSLAGPKGTQQRTRSDRCYNERVGASARTRAKLRANVPKPVLAARALSVHWDGGVNVPFEQQSFAPAFITRMVRWQ